MAENIVTAIYGFEPRREGELPTAFSLGGRHNDRTITAIIHETHNYGDHGIGWYIVKSGDDVLMEMQERAVAEVYYTQPTLSTDTKDGGGEHG